ncbi:MAG: helix-turn-helix domain-containing protein [Patescibacteria group bacterium]|nr:helix-turn-helix domain-containing protein [Patescibacteria group bacterium]
MDHSYVTRKEASSILHCSLKTIDRYVASGKIGAQKQGGQVRLLHADVHKIYTEKHGSGFQNI